MDTWLWIVVLIVLVALLAGAVLMVTRGRQSKLESRRAEAGVLRDRAEVRVEQAERREALAEEQAQAARREREAAEVTAHRADEIDPDVH